MICYNQPPLLSMHRFIMSFASLGLTEQILTTVAELGFKEATPVQKQAIPLVLQGHDVLAGAQTGTGKTAAFGLPLIQRLIESPIERHEESKVVRSLILTPTRELAQQVFDSLVSYTQNTELKVVVAYGGTSINVQKENLLGGADILIATPGRLLDHLHIKTITLNQAEYLVLDEADRMLDMGFIPDIKKILRKMPDERQTLFFSATFSKKVREIAYYMLNKPKEVQVTPTNSTADTVEQMVYPVDKHRKSELLAYLIGSRNWQQVLVFTKTKQGSDELVKELKKDGIKAASINGDKSQGARLRALEEFKTGKVRALIATDVAARGLDIEQLECVINYELPFKAEDYVHRIGRTGRAGHTGKAISLMSMDEEYLLKAIETLLDTRLPQEWLQGYEPDPNAPLREDRPRQSRGRSSDKRKMKAKLKIHANRGKNKR
ncbi:DEAD/DEAH box helicase [Aliivibrio fischeri]|uniref:DEAD-box ATP-dependent RNA helicase RhpA n=2 Tax=Aliivibrio fischeri TaxID=668 RepID=A0A6N3YWP3_ALIFS|nr:DEAD/DEAH box helicase [Aliivibrio fischeri]MUJ27224.1 DEAD/DEAH box helicase [Aliivibrio fischeri]MUK39497.1 DEAD/DEAH box helicase [Aliivibrio fischeri]MUK46282.1 DEAD/DEAH box helicase [Aliivibrio fischeri]MUK82005.1 DEAD/DEAH box helicase [Aliivibrio fischeri]